MGAAYDLVIRGGTIIDGTGGDPFEGDVAVQDGKIVSVADGAARGKEEIDARNKVVTPGFVDIHTHYDGQVTWESRLKPSSMHGATTVVIGNCGVGFAPCRQEQHELLIHLMEGVEDIPNPVLTEGLPWTWESYPEYLDTLAGRAYDIDVGSYLPHAALRVFVMGERGVRREAATAQDREQMTRLFREGLRAGALGLGTSRTIFHRSSDGNSIPTLSAEEEELQDFARVLAEEKCGVLQVVSDFSDGDREFAMLKRLAHTSGRPLTFSFTEAARASDGSWRSMLKLVAEANAEGLDIRPQVLGRAIGVMLGHQMTLNPFCMHKSYKELAKLPLAQKVAALRDPAVKARILADAPDPTDTQVFAQFLVNFERMYEMGAQPEYEPAPESCIAARAKWQGMSPEEMVYDIMLQNDGKGLLYAAIVNFADGNLDSSHEMLAHPNTVFGLGDGGAHCSTICDASYSTFALDYWGRRRPGGKTFPLPMLINRMTRETARIVGLNDRGVVAPGYRADLNVIDLDGLRLHTPELHHDLPAGGQRLVQQVDGYDATIVAGAPIRRYGEATDALPGRLVRGGQSAA